MGLGLIGPGRIIAGEGGEGREGAILRVWGGGGTGWLDGLMKDGGRVSYRYGGGCHLCFVLW